MNLFDLYMCMYVLTSLHFISIVLIQHFDYILLKLVVIDVKFLSIFDHFEISQIEFFSVVEEQILVCS